MVQTPHQWRCRSGGSHLVHHKDLHHKDCNKVHLDHFNKAHNMVHKAYNKGYNMDTKEKDFKMLAARHQKPFRPLDLRAARHHKPDLAEPAGEPATGLPDDGPRRGESDEVPRPTIFTAAFGTVYHVRPSCGKLRCASRIFRHEAFTPCPCGSLQRGGMVYILDNKYHTVSHSGFPMPRRACAECAG